jgi:hypothetical protein
MVVLYVRKIIRYHPSDENILQFEKRFIQRSSIKLLDDIASQDVSGPRVEVGVF